MRIIIDINHPAHVHYFKNFIWIMEKKGYKIQITTVNKDITLDLLDAYNFKYQYLGKNVKNLLGKLINLIILERNLYIISKKFKPDLFIGFSPIRASLVSKILNAKCIAIDDTEHAKWEQLLYIPFTDIIFTPTCFFKNLGNKQINFNGYTELLYLHPEYFTPDARVLDKLDLTENDTFFIVRFVSWGANHDIGHHGIRDKISLVKKLEEYGRVLITSEGELPVELEKYRIKVSPEKLHDLLWYATLYVGEGATTASECAVLGTHAIYINTLRLGYTNEEENKYDLLYSFSEPELMEQGVIEKAKQLLENKNLWEEGKRKRVKLLNDKIDVTAFIVWFVENYPDSVNLFEKNPEIQDVFRADLV